MFDLTKNIDDLDRSLVRANLIEVLLDAKNDISIPRNYLHAYMLGGVHSLCGYGIISESVMEFYEEVLNEYF